MQSLPLQREKQHWLENAHKNMPRVNLSEEYYTMLLQVSLELMQEVVEILSSFSLEADPLQKEKIKIHRDGVWV